MATISTEEETNYLRMVALIIGVCPKAVRTYFDGIFPPANLAADLHTHTPALMKIKKKNVLTSSQWVLLFPTGSTNVTSINFDLTLLICLLRNISKIGKPSRGFDVLPAITDVSPADDLARIKYYRNMIAHSDDSKMSNQTFHDAWIDVVEATTRLGGSPFQQKCADLKIASLDRESLEDLMINLKQINEDRFKELTDKVQNVEAVVVDPVPVHKRARIKKAITDWQSVDEKFVETNSSKQLYKCLKENNFVSVTGSAGIGKSITSRHVALQMMLEGYDVIPVKSPSEIFVSKNKTLYIYDDICGRYEAIQHEIEDWDRHIDVILDCYSLSPIKILANCRLQVYQSPKFQTQELLTKCKFDMSIGKNAICTDDKRKIALKYIPAMYTKQMSNEYIEQYECFPLLCSMVANFEESKIMIFLEKGPYDIFEKEYDKMKNIGSEMNYCALAVTTIFNNKLNERLLTNEISQKEKEIFTDIFEACGQNTCTSRISLKTHLDSLIGSFISKEDNVYSFRHEKLFDISCLYFSKKFISCMVKNCEIVLLFERFELECTIKEDQGGDSIVLPKNLEDLFFHRLINEATDETILDIFGCKPMENYQFRERLLHSLKTKNEEFISKVLHMNHFGKTVFHLMCQLGFTDILSFCITKNVDIDYYDEIGMTPLHYACRYETESAVDFLIEADVKINIYKRRGFTPLYEACRQENIDIVKKLLQHGACPNLSTQRSSIPLIVSTENGNLEIIKMLIEHKADVNRQNRDGRSALHYACCLGQKDIADLLITHGADIDLKTKHNESPLHLACIGLHGSIVDILISDTTDIFQRCTNSNMSTFATIVEKNEKEILRKLLKTVSDKNMLYPEIEFACTTKNVFVLQGILEVGIDVNTRLSKGDSALHITCRNGFYLGAEMLIGKGAYINEYSKDGLTTIQLACVTPNKQLVDLLISNGASVNNWRKGSAIPHALHITCIMKEDEMAISLINGNADVNQIAELKRNTVYRSEKSHCITNIYDEVYSHTRLMISPLEIVCIGKMLNLNLVEVLLKNGANSNIKSLSGIKPLLIASFYKYDPLVKLLLNNKADANVCDNIDILCLSNMHYKGDEDISELLSYGNVCFNNTKTTPLHVAIINNSQSIVNELLQNRARNDIACDISPFMFAIQNDRRNIPTDRQQIIDFYRNYKKIEDILPLHAACLLGFRTIAEILVKKTLPHDKEAVILIRPFQVACIKGHMYEKWPYITNKPFSLSALQIACLGQYWDTCKMLIQNGVVRKSTFEVSDLLVASFLGDKKNIELTMCDKRIYETSVLRFAYENKGIEIVKQLLETNKEDEFDDDLKTLFFIACSKGDTETVSHICSIVHKYNINDYIDATPLHTACENGNAETVQFLLSQNAYVDSISIENETPLHIACKKGLNDVVRSLLQRGAKPFLTNKHGENVYHLVSRYNYLDCARSVFEFRKKSLTNTDAEPGVNSRTVNGKNALYFSFENKNKNMMKLILNFGANADEIFDDIEEPLLLKACREDSLELVEVLLEYSSAVNRKTFDGKDALYFSYKNQNKMLMKCLLRYGATINNYYGTEGETLLSKACRKGYVDIVSILLDECCYVNAKNNNGETALCIACQCNEIAIATLLTQNGADINKKSYEGLCPLYFACINENENMANLLLQNNAYTDIMFSDSQSMLMKCCTNKFYGIVDLLLKHGADVNICHYAGETALYNAFQMGDAKLMLILLKYDADWDVCCHEKEQFLYEACERGLEEIVEIILQRDPNINVNAILFDNKTSLYACYSAISDANSSQYKIYISIGSLLRRHGANLFTLTKANDSPFHQLCMKCRPNDIKVALESCVVERNALEIVFQYACSQNDQDIAMLLWDFCKQPFISENSLIRADNENNHITALPLLLQLDVNMVDKTGKTALHIACLNGNSYMVEQLLQSRNTDVGIQANNGYTALHFACFYGHLRVIHMLIERGANIQTRTYSDETVVELAFSQLKGNVITCLLDLNEFETLQQCKEKMQLFLKTYCCSNSMKKPLRRILTLMNPSSYIDTIDYPLHFACRKGDGELIDQLLEKRSNVDCISFYGETPLIICISNNDLQNVKLLLEKGASVNKLANISEYGIDQLFVNTSIYMLKDVTPISLACFFENLPLIQILIDYNAKINTTVHICYYNTKDCPSKCEIMTPLFISVIQNNLHSVHLLVEGILDSCLNDLNYILIGSLYNNSDLTEENCHKCDRLVLTPFQAACVTDRTDIASYFAQTNQVDVNLAFQISPVLLSLYFQYPDMMIRVIDTYGLVNKNFETEVTPLIFSALVGNFRLMDILLDNSGNHECYATISVLLIAALSEDVLRIFDCYSDDYFVYSECFVNPLAICLLRKNMEMASLLLNEYASTSCISEMDASHIICFRKQTEHLRLIFESRLNLRRKFNIQMWHLLIMEDDQSDYYTSNNISALNPIYLCVTLIELSCFLRDTALLELLLKSEYTLDGVMEISPLLLSLLFMNKPIVLSNALLQLLDTNSYGSSSRLCKSAWMVIAMISNKHALDILTLRLTEDSFQMTNSADLGLAMLVVFYMHHDLVERQLYDMKYLSTTDVLCEVSLAEINAIELLFNDNEDENIYNNEIEYQGMKNIHNNVIEFQGMKLDRFKINLAYLTLLRNKKLKCLPVQAYNGSINSLPFFAVEMFYLIQQRIPRCLLSVNQISYEKTIITQLMVACLLDNKSNVNFLCYMGKSVQLNEMSFWHLASIHKVKLWDSCPTIFEMACNSNFKATFNELHLSCMKEKMTIVKYLLKNNCDVNASACLTPLHMFPIILSHHFYLEHSHLIDKFIDIIDSLKSSRSNMDFLVLPVEFNAIHLVMFSDDIEYMKLLIQKRCDLNAVAKLSTLSLYLLHFFEDDSLISFNTVNAISEVTAMHIACILDKSDFVEFLLSNKSNINSYGSIHPLHLNAFHCEDILELITDKSFFTLTVFHTAILCRNTYIAEILIENGTNFEMTASLYLELYIQNDKHISTQSSVKSLHLAYLFGNEHIFRTILSKTLLMNINEKVSLSAWHLFDSDSIHDMTSHYTSKGDIQLTFNILHIACITGDSLYANVLINEEANVNLEAEMCTTDFTGNEIIITKCPLHFAAEIGSLDLCKILIENGAKLDVKTNVIGFQPWHLALYHGYDEVVYFLLTYCRLTNFNRKQFLFVFILFLLRKNFSKIVLPFIAKSKHFLILLAFYKYLMNVLGFTGDLNFHSRRITSSEYTPLTTIDNGSLYHVYEELMSVYETIDTSDRLYLSDIDYDYH
ncbi:uncharacterized protein [Mytilus edulis]|uniref:uncharacterized protein isoform X1 n=2 Tax=Mytilus edulis TaxID=6550 RepID=UPI0039EE50F7